MTDFLDGLTVAMCVARLLAGRREIRLTLVDMIADKYCYFTTYLNRFGSALFYFKQMKMCLHFVDRSLDLLAKMKCRFGCMNKNMK